MKILILILISILSVNAYSQVDLNMGLKKIYWGDGGPGGLNEIRSYNINTYTGDFLFDTDYSHITLNAGGNSANARQIRFKIGGKTKAYFNTSGLIFPDNAGGISEIKNIEVNSYTGDLFFDTDYSHITLNAGGNSTNARQIRFKIGGETKAIISQTLFSICGTLRANEIIVDTDCWSDFVFNNDYELKDLEEVETYIKKNKHLPDIPSEKEVLENGVQLGEMNAKLLQKIEELTLYMIEQNKETKTMKAQLKELAKENQELNVKITKLEAAE